MPGYSALRVLAAQAPPWSPPNVVLIVTDDQGYGDLACTGNPVLKTPNLDRLYSESVRLTDFHVDPTCSPTRAALMTGRYSTRTGVWHTVMGRNMPRAEERMMPEVFANNGYATAIFGKWHLGDNHPFRPQDRGFQEVLVHGGGGIGQIPDYWGNDYTDDTYLHNGRPQKFTGYCTDVFFAEATRYIEAHRERPFFVYIATNTPHSPYRVPEEWSAPYTSQVGADAGLATFYGMIANIDHNVGRLRRRLRQLGLADNTLLIFMTDNGTARGATFSDRRGNDGRLVSGYNAGRRGLKGSPYEGGHRVPCFIHWPVGKLVGGRDAGGLTAHLDLLPTLIEICRLEERKRTAFDGTSLQGLLSGGADVAAGRVLLAHHQEMPDPEKYRFASVMQGAWRLILRTDLRGDPPPAVELYRLSDDPGQTRNIAPEHPDITTRLKRAYENLWDEFSAGFSRPAEIVIGSDRQNPVELTCFDWHGSKQWHQTAISRALPTNGTWAIRAERAGEYEFSLRRWPPEVHAPITAAWENGQAIPADTARLRVGSFDEQRPVGDTTRAVAFRLSLPAGSTRLEATFTTGGRTSRGAYYVTATRLATNPRTNERGN
jgi:arylsulfatase A-like enzyme